MSTQIRNKFTVVAATVLLTLMLTIAPARAHHDHDFVAPLIAGFALGALVNYDHSSRHYYHYQHQRHGHYRQAPATGPGMVTAMAIVSITRKVVAAMVTAARNAAIAPAMVATTSHVASIRRRVTDDE